MASTMLKVNKLKCQLKERYCIANQGFDELGKRFPLTQHRFYFAAQGLLYSDLGKVDVFMPANVVHRRCANHCEKGKLRPQPAAPVSGYRCALGVGVILFIETR